MRSELNFVVLKWDKWAPLLAQHPPNDVRDIAHLIVSNEDVWVVLTYLQLRRRGLRASVSPMPVRGAINILDGIHIQPEHVTPDMYIVGCRGDGHYPGLCQTVIHQNTLRAPRRTVIYVPQWMQPGLLPRNPTRSRIERIGFFGHAAVNLLGYFHDEAFADQLRNLGCELSIRDRGERVCWHDYRDIDLVLSVRDIPYEHLKVKPANKLINAWYANTPAIIGPEPAIQALRRSQLDYFEARQPDEILQILKLLRSRPALYEEMILHGRKRAASYTDDALSRLWKIALNAIGVRFQQWQRMTSKQMDRAYMQRIRDHHRALDKHERDIHRSYRNRGFEKKWWESIRPPSQPSPAQP
jgi:hypothetical protein